MSKVRERERQISKIIKKKTIGKIREEEKKYGNNVSKLWDRKFRKSIFKRQIKTKTTSIF